MKQLTLEQLEELRNISGQLMIDYNDLEYFIGEKQRESIKREKEKEEFREILAIRLREIREREKETRSNVGAYVGVSASAVSNYENKQSLPELRHLIRIASYFQVSIDWLVGRSEYDGNKKEVDNLKMELAERDYILNQIKDFVCAQE